MFVCVCNALRDHEVDDAVRDGCHQAEDVFSYYDCTPCCGQCVDTIAQRCGRCPKRDVCKNLSLAPQRAESYSQPQPHC